MKNFVKRSVCLIFALIMLLTSIVCVSAQPVPADADDGAQIASAGDSDIMPCADEIIWKYMTINGCLYKRRWNVTQQTWYDRAWIYVG